MKILVKHGLIYTDDKFYILFFPFRSINLSTGERAGVIGTITADNIAYRNGNVHAEIFCRKYNDKEMTLTSDLIIEPGSIKDVSLHENSLTK